MTQSLLPHTTTTSHLVNERENGELAHAGHGKQLAGLRLDTFSTVDLDNKKRIQS